MRTGRLVVAVLIMGALFALGFGFGRLSGVTTGEPDISQATVEVSVPVITVTETAAEVTQTVVVTG